MSTKARLADLWVPSISIGYAIHASHSATLLIKSLCLREQEESLLDTIIISRLIQIQIEFDPHAPYFAVSYFCA